MQQRVILHKKASHHLFVSLHYHPSWYVNNTIMMLICQVSRNVVSDVFILQVFLFFFFGAVISVLLYLTVLRLLLCMPHL